MKRINDFRTEREHIALLPEQTLAVGEEVELSDYFADVKLQDLDMRRATSSRAPKNVRVSVGGPFHYLGHGREKLVLSAIHKGERVAIGLPIDPSLEGVLTPGLDPYRLVRGKGLPTYNWYAQASDWSVVMMPDLSQEYRVYGLNQSTFLAPDAQLIQEKWHLIDQQMVAITGKTARGRAPIVIPHDVYFLLVKGVTVRAFCGDYDIWGFERADTLDHAFQHNRESAGHFMYEVRKRVAASLENHPDLNQDPQSLKQSLHGVAKGGAF